MKKLILKYTLLNATQHDGEANVHAVLGKIISEKPELKKDINKVRKEIEKTVKEINSWSLDKRKNEIIIFLKNQTRKGMISVKYPEGDKTLWNDFGFFYLKEGMFKDAEKLYKEMFNVIRELEIRDGKKQSPMICRLLQYRDELVPKILVSSQKTQLQLLLRWQNSLDKKG